MNKSTTIKISLKLRDKLKELGKMGESYEDVIWKLIDRKSERRRLPERERSS